MMTNRLNVVIGGLIIVCLVGIFFQQYQIINNQRLQIEQQFHSDFIGLVNLYDDELLNKLEADADFADHGLPGHSCKEHLIVNLALQRIIMGYLIKDGWTNSEWETYVESAKESFAKKAFCDRWKKTKSFYSEDVQNFIENTLMKD